MKNNIKGLTKIATVAITAGILGNCSPIKYFVFEGYYEGHPVIVERAPKSDFIAIGENPLDRPEIKDKKKWFLDAEDKNRDSKYDKILFSKNLPKGHELEKYAHPDSLKKIREYILKNGKKLN